VHFEQKATLLFENTNVQNKITPALLDRE